MTDLSAKFDSYGIEHEDVDGMDLFAVLEVAERATQRVRETGAPYAIEAITYRIAPHGAADFLERYRTKEEIAEWRQRDPIGIVDEGSQIIDGNVWALLWLLGGISLVLALFNVLPLLPFDGGHAAVVIYEWAASKVKGREVRVDFKKLMPVTAVVLAVFLTLGLSAMFLDIRQAVGN